MGTGDILGIYVNGTQGKPLNEAFEPLSISVIRPVASGVEIEYSSPYTGRPTQIEGKSSLGDPTWTAQSNAQITDLGQGRFRATVPTANAAAGFYQVAVLPPPPVFFDDFETAIAGWTHGGNEDRWERGVPTTGPTTAYSPTQVYTTGLSRNVGAYSDTWLRTPDIDLTGVGSATLTFAEWLNLDFIPGYTPAEQTQLLEGWYLDDVTVTAN